MAEIEVDGNAGSTYNDKQNNAKVSSMKMIHKRMATFALVLVMGSGVFAGCGGQTVEPATEATQMSTLATTEPISTEPVYAGMRTDMTSREYADEMGLGINLGNTMEGYWQDLNKKKSGAQTITQIGNPYAYETCWGARVTTPEIIHGMKEAGFNTVRVPVYWGNAMDENTDFVISQQLFDRLDEIISYVLDDGMYCVINVHHYDEHIIRRFPQEKALVIMDNLWHQIAEHYRDYPDQLIFEGYNENVGSVQEGKTFSEEATYAYVNALNQTFVDAVRETGGNNDVRLLIVSGYWTNIDLTTDKRFAVPQDTVADRIMVSVHYVDNAMYWSNQIGGQAWMDYSTSQCELLKEAFTDKGFVTFIGECTAYYDPERMAEDAAITDSTGCLGYMYDLMLSYGFVPVLWVTDDQYFYDRGTCQVTSEDNVALLNRLTENQ